MLVSLLNYTMNLLFFRNLGYIQSIYYSEYYFHKEIKCLLPKFENFHSWEKIQLINIKKVSKHEKPKNRPKLPPTAATMAAKSYKSISVKTSISELPCMYQIIVELERLSFIYIKRTCNVEEHCDPDSGMKEPITYLKFIGTNLTRPRTTILNHIHWSNEITLKLFDFSISRTISTNNIHIN